MSDDKKQKTEQELSFEQEMEDVNHVFGQIGREFAIMKAKRSKWWIGICKGAKALDLMRTGGLIGPGHVAFFEGTQAEAIAEAWRRHALSEPLVGWTLTITEVKDKAASPRRKNHKTPKTKDEALAMVIDQADGLAKDLLRQSRVLRRMVDRLKLVQAKG